MNWHAKLERARRITAALLILAVAALAGVLPVAAERPNGAGLVIRHGDGTLIYVYVQFEEESISGEELLYRSGLDLALAPFSGLGVAVCAIDGEGCPADNCFCRSYDNPSYYWHYYALVDGHWAGQMIGPSSRRLYDGDVDGWSWTAGDSELPAITIDEIAAINGVDRTASEPTPTPEPPKPTPEPTATAEPPTPQPTPTPTPSPAPESVETSEPAPPATPTPTPTATAQTPPTPAATNTSTDTTGQVSAAEPSPTRQAAKAPSPSLTLTPTPTANELASTPLSQGTTTAQALPNRTLTPRATSVAVLVPPEGTPVALNIHQPDDAFSPTSYVAFGALAFVAAGAGLFVYLRNRGAGGT